MKWNQDIRQFHRWVSIIFTAAVILNLVALGRGEPAGWVGLLALFPLVVLAIHRAPLVRATVCRQTQRPATLQRLAAHTPG